MVAEERLRDQDIIPNAKHPGACNEISRVENWVKMWIMMLLGKPSEMNLSSHIILDTRSCTREALKLGLCSFLTRSVGNHDVISNAAQSPWQIDTEHHDVVQGIIWVFRIVVEVHDDEQDVEDQSYSPPGECTRVSEFLRCVFALRARF